MRDGLTEMPEPAAPRSRGRRTEDFRGRRVPDRSVQDARNRTLGLAGEHAVIAEEQRRLRSEGREDLAAAIRHVSVSEGDGAGYDVFSFGPDGSSRHIEVKTTRGGAESDFYISANEVEFSKRHSDSYRLYRVYGFEPDSGRGYYYVMHGSLVEGSLLRLDPVQFRARLVAVTGGVPAQSEGEGALAEPF